MQDRGTSADDLFTDVQQRWAIETMYRDIKHTFLSDSGSPNGTVRHFYFQFSVLLYNTWRTARVLADADNEITLKDVESPLTAFRFVSEIIADDEDVAPEPVDHNQYRAFALDR